MTQRIDWARFVVGSIVILGISALWSYHTLDGAEPSIFFTTVVLVVVLSSVRVAYGRGNLSGAIDAINSVREVSANIKEAAKEVNTDDEETE